MRNPYILFFIGFLIIILPYLGFPTGIKNFLFILFGLIIIGFAYQSRRKPAVKTFTESVPQPQAIEEQTFLE